MSTVTIASDPADAEAAERIEQHHAQMAGRLGVLTAALLTAVREGRSEVARRDLLDWARNELVPHAAAEEESLYPAASGLPETRLLVEAMLAEHKLIHGLVRDLSRATDPVQSAAIAQSLRTVFESHLAKENDQLLPSLVGSAHHSLADMLAGMHALIGPGGADASQEAAHSAEHPCGCEESDAAGYPELDARAVPHAIRHATIFGALDGVRPGGGLVLIAPHDPLPLLAQVEQRSPGMFEVGYLERGPETWRLQFVRGS